MFTSNEDYGDGGNAPLDERAELNRIRQEGNTAGLSVGTVHAFVLAPDGHLRDTMHVATVRPDTLAATLEKHATALKVPAGAPVVPPAPPVPPPCAPGDLRLHLVARYLERQPSGEYTLVTNAGGNWSALPGEDWITFRADEAKRLLPTGKSVRPGQTWNVDRTLAARVLNYFYPPTENNDVAKNRIEEQTLRATIVSVIRGEAVARLDGALRMKHPFYHKDDDKFAQARIVGYLVFDTSKRTVRSLQLVTDQADYGGPGGGRLPFGVAVRSVP